MAFKSFTAETVKVHSDVCGDLDIFTKIGGPESAEPLVLLHGYPQSHYIWAAQAEELAKHYRVILLDLRGYGRSSKPKGNPETHIEYSKREMAKDVIQVANHFGYKTFNLVAHDRGGRVAHRLVLDHPGVVTKLMILDICPTIYHFETTDMEFASKYWHWFFQLLPNAEEMIHANPKAYFKTATRSFNFTPEAHKDYFDAFSTWECIHGSCEDYRAAATIDLEHDAESRKQNVKIQVPKVRILWGEEGLIPKYGDVVGVWQSFSAPTTKVTGRSMPSGHYVSEQDPEETLKEILAFLAD